ncbi:MAG: hypothetical protein LBT36_02280 [Oscillospiraceae bacterium]|nr:hypothetical protein [Oscillospiraceae bacterium]
MVHTTQKRMGIVALCLIAAVVALCFGTITALAAGAVDVVIVSVPDGSGFSRDSDAVSTGNDASVRPNEPPLPAAPNAEVPFVPDEIVGELVPGAIYTSVKAYGIAEGQYITYDGSWSSGFQSLDVGLYNTETGEYSWFNQTGGTITNFRLFAENSALYRVAYRNPSENIYTTKFYIAFVIDC